MTMKTFTTVSVPEFKQLIASEPQAMILDCRDLKDYKAAHIDNALHVHEGLRDALIKKGEKQRPLLIYCYYGHASEHLAQMFADFGFEKAYSLAGGFSGWKEQTNS
jgi:thiosulfate sulfurtransferase